MSELIEASLQNGSYQEHLSPDPNNKEPVSRMAKRFFDYDNREPLEFAINWIRDNEPENPAFWYLVGLNWNEATNFDPLDDVDSAEDAFEICIEKIKKLPANDLDKYKIEILSDSLGRLNRKIEIEKIVREQIKIYPNIIFYYELLGEVFFLQRKTKDLENIFNVVLGLKADAKEFYSKISFWLKELGSINKAIEGFQLLIDNKHNISENSICLGLIYEERDDFDQALEVYKGSINAGCTSSELLFRLGITLKRLNYLEEAVSALELIVQEGNESWSLLGEISQLFSELGDETKAQEFNKRALAQRITTLEAGWREGK